MQERRIEGSHSKAVSMKEKSLHYGWLIVAVACIPAELSRLPVMVVELKGNKAAGGTIAQIKEKQYPAKLKPYAGQLLLVGMNYDEKTGRFDCLIERE